MNFAQRRLWDVVRTMPKKWQEKEHGEQYGGFWAVAVIGLNVVWYSEVEHGFCRSKFTRYGEIAEFKWNDDSLADVLQYFLNDIELGYDTEPRVSRFPGEYPGQLESE